MYSCFLNVLIAVKDWSIYKFLIWDFINGLKKCKSKWLMHPVIVTGVLKVI